MAASACSVSSIVSASLAGSAPSAGRRSRDVEERRPVGGRARVEVRILDAAVERHPRIVDVEPVLSEKLAQRSRTQTTPR
jgi:hypothetical protein